LSRFFFFLIKFFLQLRKFDNLTLMLHSPAFFPRGASGCPASRSGHAA